MRLRMRLYRPTTKQSGFSIIEVSLVAVVVAALAATGLVIYQHHKPSIAKNSATAMQTQSTATTTTPAQTVDPYGGWRTYTASEGSFTFKYPADWYVAGG